MFLTEMSTVNHDNLKNAPVVKTPRQQLQIKLKYYTELK